MSGRPPLVPSNGSRSSVASLPSIEGLSGYASGASLSATEIPEGEPVHHESGRHGHGKGSHDGEKHRNRAAERLLAQVAEWLQHEKAKSKSKKKHHYHWRKAGLSADAPAVSQSDHELPTSAPVLQTLLGRARTNSIDSESSDVSFDRLQRIVDEGMASMGLSSPPHMSPSSGRPRRTSSARKRRHSHGGRRALHRAASSDTDFVDGDVVVPGCDAVLDNSKAMSYTMGRAGMSTTNLALPTPGEASSAASIGGEPSSSSFGRKHTKEEAERQAWLSFKRDIIRLAHTLKLKGWRRVPLDNAEAADAVGVERLSGALTNAVYVVNPPADLSRFAAPSDSMANSTASLSSSQYSGKKQPEKLLLRVYGPQVEHLIDREAELAVLRRLAKKKIGPRLLGTFANGRFEQFFNASPLTPDLLRDPETSILIAKRMRELHDGVEVLDHERLGGPAVWRNWDRWLDMVERRVLYLDQLVKGGKGSAGGWKENGFVCGVEWGAFKDAVGKYRAIIDGFYEEMGINVRDRLVFAHNDTQYGNILRIHPDDEKSPLLRPANEHKQLVVIDFEYAAPNTPGFEFANHFTEWTYNYHDEWAPHACNHRLYPTPDEQRRFIRAYIEHRPKFSVSTANTPLLTPLATPPLSADPAGAATGGTPGERRKSAGTPSAGPHTGSSSSIVEFMLDARVPPGGWKEEERRREEEKEQMVRELMDEAKLWRLVNSAQWVAWGIVQAKIKGFTEDEEQSTPTPTGEGKRLGETQEVVETGPTEGELVETEYVPSPLEPDDSAADEFDYLSYAHERAMFVLGDCIGMGVLKWEELDEKIHQQVKITEY